MSYEIAEELILEARVEHRPIKTFCLFSGGNDSAVLAHHCRGFYHELLFIDTGTALPGVRAHVEGFADWLGKPLKVCESGDAFREMVLGGNGGKGFGFPGPGQHGRAYQRLKERQLEAALRDTKVGQPRTARVMFLSGVRRAESARRAERNPITRRWSAVFVNPLIDWSNDAMRAYRFAHGLPQSDVAALIHRSGECNCGSFAAPGEREMLQSLWPDWFEKNIASLEREAEARGIAACRWGERPPRARPARGGPMCSSCDARAGL